MSRPILPAALAALVVLSLMAGCAPTPGADGGVAPAPPDEKVLAEKNKAPSKASKSTKAQAAKPSKQTTKTSKETSKNATDMTAAKASKEQDLKTYPWLDKTIIDQKGQVLVVGHSGQARDEEEAREEALADAASVFLRHSGVGERSFDRSMEIYSTGAGGGFNGLDRLAQNKARARALKGRAVPEEWYVMEEEGGYVASVLLKVPARELNRIRKEKGIGLLTDVLFFHAAHGGGITPLADGATMRSGDGYAFYLRPSDTCYVYIYQVDSMGISFRLFPNEDFRTNKNPVPAAADLWVPNGDELLELDEARGREQIFLIASPRMITELEGGEGVVLPEGRLDGVVEQYKLAGASLTKKVAPSTARMPRPGIPSLKVTNKLQSGGAFFYTLWFMHE